VRILLDGLEHSLTNMGDVAMLQVAVARLRRWWPDALIEAVVDAPERLARYCPGVRPIPWRGYRRWLHENRMPIGSRLYSRVPLVQAGRLSRLEMRMRHRWPALNRSLIEVRLKRSVVDSADTHAFLESLRAADLVVIAGGGGITDVFKDWAMEVLETLWMAVRQDMPTAMLSQGFGPIRDPLLSAQAKRVLPSVGLIAIREERTGRQLLQSLNVSPDRVITTGDDAIELAYGCRTANAGRGIGVNLRMASYSEIDGRMIDMIRQALYEAAATHEAELIPVPISFQRGESDVRSIQTLLNGHGDTSQAGEGLDDPVRVIEQVKRCRVVVTGSYHPAVFALSQGIPVVGLAKSEYYLQKFLGLADQFGAGIEILSLEVEQLPAKLTIAIGTAWRSAEDVLPALLDAAWRQIESGQMYYQRMYQLANR
jgi:polysaccharide pyruvyl transferase WcaK-like protein